MYTEDEKEKGFKDDDKLSSDLKSNSGDDMYMELVKNIENLEADEDEDLKENIIEYNEEIEELPYEEIEDISISFPEIPESIESEETSSIDDLITNTEIKTEILDSFNNQTEEVESIENITSNFSADDTQVQNKTQLDEAVESKKSSWKMHGSLKIIIPLALICGFVALVIALVNHYTDEVILKNNELEKQNAIMNIFGEYVLVEKYEASSDEIYLVQSEGELVGYCVAVSPAGFGGEIDMIVGINGDGTVRGINIISMSETPGLGTKTKTEGFLSQFVGKSSGNMDLGVDGITGATISSKAVEEGVREALKFDLTALFKKEETSDTEYTENINTSETEPDSLTGDTDGVSSVQITQPAIDKVEYIMQVKYFKSPVNNVNYEEDSLEYRTETESSDDTDTDTETDTTETTTKAKPTETTKKEPDTPKATESKTEPPATESVPAVTDPEPDTSAVDSESESSEETTGIDDITSEPEEI